MPKKFPPEFKRDVVTVARRGDLTVPEVAADFDVSEESVRRWVKQADRDDGIVAAQTNAASDYADGAITAPQLRVITARLRPQLEALELLSSPPPDPVGALSDLITSDEVRATWDGLDVRQRREVIALLMQCGRSAYSARPRLRPRGRPSDLEAGARVRGESIQPDPGLVAAPAGITHWGYRRAQANVVQATPAVAIVWK